jgi:hypothetical protein
LGPAAATSPKEAASTTKQLVLQDLRTSEKPLSAAEVSATIGISNDATLAAVGSEGHQFARPIIAARAGTVMLRTTNVSISRPTPMMNPVCTMVERLPNNRPNIEAAKIMPAEVMTPPVERTARMMPVRIPEPDSSRIRVINSRL